MLCAVLMGLTFVFGNSFMYSFFSVPGKGHFVASNPFHWFRIFSHGLGHANWSHLLGNLTLILLLGPLLEEKFKSLPLLFMMLITVGVTGILNILFFPSGLLGASGIAFMMILLSSFSSKKGNGIPLTFILVALLFLTREFSNMFQNNQISEFAHIIGGILGALFGFLKR